MRILVTGGAGLIGSHTVDLLVKRGYDVRVLDNLELPTHAHGPPAWLRPDVPFIRGDVRSRDDLERALTGVEGVIHLAATGGFTPDISRYFQVNTLGTANLLEVLRQPRFQGTRVVVASSVGVYGEGNYTCAACDHTGGATRTLEQLDAGDWEPRCPSCGQTLAPAGTPETKPVTPSNAYCISKYDQERLVLGFGATHGNHTVALRYFLTYGPRQSLSNPYTGVISIFASRLRSGLPPVVFEDGGQLRDFVYVGDVARANVLALEDDRAAGRVFNVGGGAPTRILDVAQALCDRVSGGTITPELPGQFRPGEARHVYADVSALGELGFEAQTSLEDGIDHYLAWLDTQEQVQESFGSAMVGLQRAGVVRGTGTLEPASEGGETVAEEDDASLSIVLPSYNEAGNLESIVRAALEKVPTFAPDFEILVVNDGSRDGTGALADRLSAEDPRVRVVHHPFNMGYGAAQKSGFKAATKAWVAVVPADHQFDIRDLAQFMAAREGADIVGSVRVERRDTWDRLFVSRLFNGYMRTRHGIPLSDLNWVKMFRRSILDEIDIESRGFAVDAEIVVKAAANGHRVKEIEVEHYPRTWGDETSISFRNIYSTARELVKLPKMLRGDGD